MEPKKILLSEKEACQYLGVSRSTLAQARMDGKRESRFPPPPFVKLGRMIRYNKVDLDEWIKSQTNI